MEPGLPLSPPDTLQFTITGTPLLPTALNCSGVFVDTVPVPGEMLKVPFEGLPIELDPPQPASTTMKATHRAARRLEGRICNNDSRQGNKLVVGVLNLSRKEGPAGRAKWQGRSQSYCDRVTPDKPVLSGLVVPRL